MNNNEEKQSVADRPSTVQDIVLWIGIDWADQKHCLVTCRLDGSGSQLHWVDQKPERLEEFFLDLRRKHPTGRIGVVLEQSRGALLYALLKSLLPATLSSQSALPGGLSQGDVRQWSQGRSARCRSAL